LLVNSFFNTIANFIIWIYLHCWCPLFPFSCSRILIGSQLTARIYYHIENCNYIIVKFLRVCVHYIYIDIYIPIYIYIYINNICNLSCLLVTSSNTLSQNECYNMVCFLLQGLFCTFSFIQVIPEFLARRKKICYWP
jgi:hypothetical protein